MNASFVRVFVVPALPSGVLDALVDVWSPLGELGPTVHDRDLDCVTAGLRLGEQPAVVPERSSGLQAALKACAVLREAARDAVLFLDVQSAAGSMPADSGKLGALLSESLDAPVHVRHRSEPASVWTALRAVSWGVDGLCVRSDEPSHPRAGARCRGVSLEFGAPTILIKAALHGVPPSALRRICDATGSPRAGLAHTGAYPAISVLTGEPLIVLEVSDPAKSPLHRALAIVDIEAARYGGSLGPTTLLSQLPLSALLDTLSARMRLDAKPAQIIETHLSKPTR